MPLTDKAALLHLAHALGKATGLGVRVAEQGRVTDYVSPFHLHPDPAGPELPALLNQTHRAGVSCTTACAFDPDLAEDIGKAMGEECRQENVAVLLGPAAGQSLPPGAGAAGLPQGVFVARRERRGGVHPLPPRLCLCRAFAYYNVNTSDWFVEGGEYGSEIGSSSRDIRLHAGLTLPGDEGEAPDLRETAPAYYDLSGGLNVSAEQFEALYGRPVTPWHAVRPFTRNTTLSELQTHPMGAAIVEQVKQGIAAAFAGSDMEAMFNAMLDDMPLRQMAMMDPVHFGGNTLDKLLAQLNA